MMHLYYQGKFHKSIDDDLAKQIMMALTSAKRPYQIEVDGELLKASQIEIRKSGDAVSHKFAYDFHNDAHKEAIRKFAAALHYWFAQQPQDRKAIEYYFAEKGAIRLEGQPRVGTRGVHIFGPNQIIVRNPELYAQLQEKYSAYQSFMRMVSKARADDDAANAALAADADQMFS